MKILPGKVIDGRIVVEGELLNEGSTVAVLVPESGSVLLSEEEEAELLEAIAEADQGFLLSADEVLGQLASLRNAAH